MTSSDPVDWNEARSLAARLRTHFTEEESSNSDVDYATLQDAYSALDFPDRDELAADIDALNGSPTEQVNALAREILSWPTDEAATTASTDFTEWNAARSLATDLIDAIDEDDPSFETVAESVDSTLPPKATVADRVADTSGPRTDRINEIARWIQTWETDEWEPDLSLNTEPTTTAETETTDEPQRLADREWDTERETLAAELLDNFDNHEGRYGELIREYPNYNLPSLGEAMMAARRATGGAETRVAQMVDYIQTWDDDPTQADTAAYRPYGKH